MAPVVLEVERPPAFQRSHVLLRLVLLVAIGWIGHPLGLLWLGLPVAAAALVSQKGGRRYQDESGPTVTRVLNWILDLVAYLALVTDELPGRGEHPVRLRIERSGTPTIGSALLRILYAIPSLVVLAILNLCRRDRLDDRRRARPGRRDVSREHVAVPVRWEAWLLAYLASLVGRYPPFTLETGAADRRHDSTDDAHPTCAEGGRRR